MALEQDQHLCQVCTSINFSEYFQRAINSRVDDQGFPGASLNAFRLGVFEDIYRKSSTCAFCRLAVDAVCNNNIWSSPTPEAIMACNQTEGRGVECWMYSYLYADNDPDTADSQKAFRIGIATRVGEEGNCMPSDHSGDIQLLAEDALRICGSQLFHGRLIGREKVDVDLPRRWLSYCEREHREFCETPSLMFDSPPIPEPQDLLVIDVRRQCICHLPQGSRYVALSYCWPTGDTFKLTRANLNELLEGGSLTNRIQELPLTIQDAVHFVLDLEETYLWMVLTLVAVCPAIARIPELKVKWFRMFEISVF